MEQVVIPEFKQKYKNNKFIQTLAWTGAKSPVGTYYVSIGMPVSVNMMPHGEGYDKGKFDELKKAFNDLKREDLYKDAAGTLWSPQELLYLYSLITTNGKISPTSLHGIF
jgi:hypothetical protein